MCPPFERNDDPRRAAALRAMNGYTRILNETAGRRKSEKD